MLIRFGLLMLRIALEWMVYVEGGRGGRGRGQTWRAAGWLYPSPRKLEIERYWVSHQTKETTCYQRDTAQRSV